MTIRAFWNILLKILGLYFVVKGVNVIMPYLGVFTSVSTMEIEDTIYYIAVTFGTLIAYFFILWLFVFKTSWLIDKLDLEKGFNEEKIDFKNDSSAIMTIAIIVIGGIMLVDALPLLCNHIFAFYQNKKMFCPPKENPATSWIVCYGIEAIIGYLLMTNSKPIVTFLNRKSAKNEEDSEK